MELKKNKVIAIIQGRLNSKRFPNKIINKIGNYKMINLILKRLNKSKKISSLILATGNKHNNKNLINIVPKNICKLEFGDENHVLKRYYKIATKYKANTIIRITADCPFIEHNLIDKYLSYFEKNNFDYISNTLNPTFPDGLDFEIFSYNTLLQAYNSAKSDYDKEHVTPFIKRNKKFNKKSIEYKKNFSFLRLTVDEKIDLEMINDIYKQFKPKYDFTFEEIIKLYNKKPYLFNKNVHLKRDEGSTMDTGNKYWKRAKEVIPGGNMFLSKRPEMFLPNKWPTYFSKAKGCYVWDLDGKKYVDTCLMGVGTNILGYGNKEVDKTVKSIIRDGNFSSLNCPEELFLSEKLIEMHPWADMVKLARTGAEANAIAIRIARAYSRKENVAVCGYHGWHDWYLSANLTNKKNLDNHLLKGLSTIGVPNKLKDSIYTFEYNNFEQLLKLVNKKNIGVIKMEVSRSFEPKNDFLQNIRNLCTKKNIILIFDECTSGFRETFGGLHKKYNIEPDICTFGKAMGNGYAITAVIGKKKIMQIAQDTFMSSTFWSERIGPSAALKTLEIMNEMKSWNIITKKGKELRKMIKLIAKKNKLDLSFIGLPSLTSFIINSKKNLFFEYKTLITQEMLKKGFLASNSIYLSVAHTDKILNTYLGNLNLVFKIIKKCEDGDNIKEYLKYPVSHKGFQRLN